MSLSTSHRDTENTPCTDTHKQVYKHNDINIWKLNQLPDPGNYNDQACEVRAPGQEDPRV